MLLGLHAFRCFLYSECVEGMEGELDSYITEIARPPDRRARARSQGLELDMSP